MRPASRSSYSTCTRSPTMPCSSGAMYVSRSTRMPFFETVRRRRCRRLGKQQIEHALVLDAAHFAGPRLATRWNTVWPLKAILRFVLVQIALHQSIAEALQLGRTHADLDHLVLLEHALGEALARADGLLVGNVVADVAGQQLENAVQEAS
jgi:hypothetical protein